MAQRPIARASVRIGRWGRHGAYGQGHKRPRPPPSPHRRALSKIPGYRRNERLLYVVDLGSCLDIGTLRRAAPPQKRGHAYLVKIDHWLARLRAVQQDDAARTAQCIAAIPFKRRYLRR
jgi:hypothetical protein